VLFVQSGGRQIDLICAPWLTNPEDPLVAWNGWACAVLDILSASVVPPGRDGFT